MAKAAALPAARPARAKREKAQKPKRHLLHKARVNRSHTANFFVFVFITLLGLFVALPFVYAIGNAFKPLNELWLFPPPLLPRNPTFNNFIDLFSVMQNSWVPMSRYLFNTIFITVVGTAGQVLFACLCAYPLAKHPFPGAKWIFRLIFFALMFGDTVTEIPRYLMIVKTGLLDTYAALLIPVMAVPMALYLMKQFMEQIHDSLIEAAKLDSANEWQIFWRIVMPLVKPAWLTLIVLAVKDLWNFGGVIMIYSEELKSFAYAVQQVAAGGIARAGIGSAMTVLLMSVPIVVFIFTQSSIIETMTSSGVKE